MAEQFGSRAQVQACAERFCLYLIDYTARNLPKLIAAYPEIPEPYNNLAVIEAGFGNLEEAVRLLNQALAINPEFATARKNLGDVFLALSIENYERRLSVSSKSAETDNGELRSA